MQNLLKKYLCLSSLFFITNAITAFIMRYYLYSFLFIFLTITSITVHCNYSVYTNIIDKIAILSIVLYGGYVFYNKVTTMNVNKYYKLLYILIVIVTFFLCIFLYTYGFIYKQYCFNESKVIGDRYHAILHALSAIGHHCIIFL